MCYIFNTECRNLGITLVKIIGRYCFYSIDRVEVGLLQQDMVLEY
jgi:hypothetical protein